jgi:hypothetical protein
LGAVAGAVAAGAAMPGGFVARLAAAAVGALGGAAAGESAAGISGAITNSIKKYKRTSSMLWMLYPDTIRFGTNANWQELNFDPNALGILASQSGVDQKGNLDFWGNAGTVVSREAKGILTKATGNGNIGDALFKNVQNTYNDMNFGNMQRRKFQFNWTLVARSAAQVAEIEKLIRTLRFHAHPSYSAGVAVGTYLTFPGQVDIEWYTKESSGDDNYTENAWLPKISSCVIDSVETDYSPNSQYSFFQDSGAPTQISLSVTFTETHPLVKSDIARGF